MTAVDAERDSHWGDELPPERTIAVDEVAEQLAGARRVVVLDDDPTGTQTVRDVAVLTSWHSDDIAWAFAQGGAGFFILTNTRSLSARDAADRNREIADRCLEVADGLGIEVVFASRSDSTLRGHFPLETDVLAQVSAEHGRPIDGILMSPAYIDAGRVTLDGVHWVRSAEGLMPVASGEFARDSTFGYTASRLADWVEEKSGGRIPASSVEVVTIKKIRFGDAPLTEVLGSVRDARIVVVDAVTDQDLRAVSLSVLAAEAAGIRLLYRVGPSFVRSRLGQGTHAPVSDEELAVILGRGNSGRTGGLVVVGSHVGLTTRQLARLAERTDVVSIELDVAAVVEGDAESSIRALAERAAKSLENGLVVITTSRTVVTGVSPEHSLEISRRISAALTEATRQTVSLNRPRFVVAKGGITSSDIATIALGIDRAWVRGSLLPGIVSLWQAASGAWEGLPYVVFAGNVGDDGSLAEVVERLEAS